MFHFQNFKLNVLLLKKIKQFVLNIKDKNTKLSELWYYFSTFLHNI
jgi:hypothetical protein